MKPTKSLSEEAYRILKEDIITGKLFPGERISQADLSEQMKIGMTPIRDALHRLGMEGFVESIPRYGYLVTGVDETYVTEIFEMRLIMEKAIVKLAAERGENKTLENIREMADFKYIFKERDTYLDFYERNANFHKAIADAARNSRLAESFSKLMVEMTRLFFLGIDARDRSEEMRKVHINLAELLLAREPEQAMLFVEKQVEFSKNRIFEAMKSNSQKKSNSLIQSSLLSHQRSNKID